MAGGQRVICTDSVKAESKIYIHACTFSKSTDESMKSAFCPDMIQSIMLPLIVEQSGNTRMFGAQEDHWIVGIVCTTPIDGEEEEGYNPNPYPRQFRL